MIRIFRYRAYKKPAIFGVLFICLIVYLFKTNNTEIETNPNKPLQRYVAISTSLEIEKDFYMFYLPVTCESWRRIGFEPIIIMVLSDINDTIADLDRFNYKSEMNSKQIVANLTLLQLKVIEYLNRLQVKIYYLRSFKNYEAQIGMLARLFIGYISRDYIANDNDYIILGDTDLFPINRVYYESYDKSDFKAISIWNALCCSPFEFNGFFYPEYAMCHIGMTKVMWRHLLSYNIKLDKFLSHDSEIGFDRSSIVRVINEFFGQNRFENNTALGRGDEAWSVDQRFISLLIEKHTRHYNTTLNKNRYSGIRLDRIYSIERWLELVKLNFPQLTDAHGFQELNPDTINATQALNEKLFNQTLKNLFNSYFEEYFAIRNKFDYYSSDSFKLTSLYNLYLGDKNNSINS